MFKKIQTKTNNRNKIIFDKKYQPIHILLIVLIIVLFLELADQQNRILRLEEKLKIIFKCTNNLNHN